MNAEKLKQIADYLLKGMTEKESCILCDVPYADYLKQKENDEPTRKFIEKQIVKFKLQHVEAIQKTKSDKNSMYLLEKLRPEEFGSKRGGEGSATVNIISAIIKEIQNDNTSTIISFNRATQKEKRSDEDAEREGLLIKGPGLLK